MSQTREIELVWGNVSHLSQYGTYQTLSFPLSPLLPTSLSRCFHFRSCCSYVHAICMILELSLSLYSDFATVTSSYITHMNQTVSNQLFYLFGCFFFPFLIHNKRREISQASRVNRIHQSRRKRLQVLGKAATFSLRNYSCSPLVTYTNKSKLAKCI